MINIGSGFEISIGDTARLIAELMGAEIEIEQDAMRLRPESSEVERLWADNGKAQELLGWSPRYGGLDGLAQGPRADHRVVHQAREPVALSHQRLQL